jgi:hypothetical protein
MMDRKEMQPDFLIRVATRAECQQFTPPIRAEVRRLLHSETRSTLLSGLFGTRPHVCLTSCHRDLPPSPSRHPHRRHGADRGRRAALS